MKILIPACALAAVGAGGGVRADLTVEQQVGFGGDSRMSIKPIAGSEFEIPAGHREMVNPDLTPPAAMASSPLPLPPR